MCVFFTSLLISLCSSYAQETLRIALYFNSAQDVGLRRAALVSMLLSIRAWQYCIQCELSRAEHSSSLSLHSSGNGAEGTLAALTSISRDWGSFDDDGWSGFDNEDSSNFPHEKVSKSQIVLLSQSLVSDAVEWTIENIGDESDDTSREVMIEIARLAVSSC